MQHSACDKWPGPPWRPRWMGGFTRHRALHSSSSAEVPSAPPGDGTKHSPGARHRLKECFLCVPYPPPAHPSGFGMDDKVSKKRGGGKRKAAAGGGGEEEEEDELGGNLGA